MKRILPLLASLPVLCGHLTAADAPLRLKTETFDRDPGWDNSSNRVVASDPPTVSQGRVYLIDSELKKPKAQERVRRTSSTAKASRRLR